MRDTGKRHLDLYSRATFLSHYHSGLGLGFLVSISSECHRLHPNHLSVTHHKIR